MKRHLKKIKNSIRLKLTLILIGLVVLLVGLLWMINLTFYPLYYQNNKTKLFLEAYQDVKTCYEMSANRNGRGILQSELEQEYINALAENNDLSIYVFRKQLIGEEMYPMMYYPYDATTSVRYLLSQRWSEIMNSDGKSSIEVVESNQIYQVYKRFDVQTNSNYLELIAHLDSNNSDFILIRSNVEGMKMGIKTTSSFLIYVGIFISIVGIIIMFFISKNFTTPILKLANISQKMSLLDFSERYPVTSQDEIGALGNSINVLSSQLENTISELKTANNELKLDNERKTQIDEMRKEFLSNVSHELKTPIALIQGYAEGLIDNVNDDPESRDFYCEVIVDEAQKMNKMVKKLLTLNQIEFGNNFVQIEHFDIVQMMNSVLNSTAIMFEQKQVTLEFDCKEPIYVWSDEYMIEEVFTNFVSNALNHVDGKKVIKVSVTYYEDCLRVSVFNTGKCIPEEELEKIWIKFYKVDKARTREYGGNGIGLSIVSAIMKSLNHEFGVYNTDSGVCFWFDVDIQNH